MAATGPTSPVPPGIPRLLGPGQSYASPALARLMASTPRDELADRYPGRQAGLVGGAAFPAPNSVIIIGRTPAQLSRMPGATELTSINTTAPSGCTGVNCAMREGVNASGVAPGVAYYVITAAGLVASLAIIAATFPCCATSPPPKPSATSSCCGLARPVPRASRASRSS